QTRRGCLRRRRDRHHGSLIDDRVYAEKRAFTHTEDWEVEMAEENFDVELQDTGEFLASTHTRTGTEEIVLMFSDVEDVSQGALNNDEATARAAVDFLLGHEVAAERPDGSLILDLSAAYVGVA